MPVDVSVLFSETNDDEFIVLLSDFWKRNLHDIFLEEFRKRGFRRCWNDDTPRFMVRGITLLDGESKAKTLLQFINRTRIYHEPHYQIMLFKSTWTSEAMEIEMQGWPSPQRATFNPRKELPKDIERYKTTTEDEIGKKNDDRDVASTSGYGSKSAISSLLGSEKWEASSSSGIQTVSPGEAVTGQDLVDEVERAVLLQLKMSELQTLSEGGYRDIQTWLKSSERKTIITDILNTKDFNRQLGNVTEEIVGVKGGMISLYSYQIQISPNAVKTETKFKFRALFEMDLIDFPQDLIPISLPLYCSPGNVNFGVPVSMKIPTWIRKSDPSTNFNPIPVYVYTMHEGEDWQCVESAELTSTGTVEFQCERFCVIAAFIKKSDAKRVLFALEHILFRDDYGAYTSCHFLSSDPFVNAMLQQLERNYEIIHPPTYTSFAKYGDQIPIKLLSRHPENYRFESLDDCVLTIDESFYILNRRESFSFLLTPETIPSRPIEFSFAIGQKRFLKRDVLKARMEATASIVVQRGGTANITQTGVTNVVVEKSRETEVATSVSQDIPLPIQVAEEDVVVEKLRDDREESPVEQPEQDIPYPMQVPKEETSIEEIRYDREEQTAVKQPEEEATVVEEETAVKKIWDDREKESPVERTNQEADIASQTTVAEENTAVKEVWNEREKKLMEQTEQEFREVLQFSDNRNENSSNQ